MKDDDELVNAGWLNTEGWFAIGNTWYPPDWDDIRPVVMWVGVDESLRVAGCWVCKRATRGDVRTALLLFSRGVRHDFDFVCDACGYPTDEMGVCTREACCNAD